MEKKGFMKMSFGMIFTIILIIAFLAFAFYGIRGFLNFQETARLEQFKENLRKDVDSAWNDLGKTSGKESYNVPDRLERICINETDISDNLYLYFNDKEFPSSQELKHINMGKTAGTCFENKGGKIEMIIEKGSDEQKVTLEEVSEEE